MIGDSEAMDDVLDEFSHPLRLEVGDGPDFDPLGEFVDGDHEVIEASRSLLKLPDHVEAPDRKQLGGDRLERYNTLGVTLYSFC